MERNEDSSSSNSDSDSDSVASCEGSSASADTVGDDENKKNCQGIGEDRGEEDESAVDSVPESVYVDLQAALEEARNAQVRNAHRNPNPSTVLYSQPYFEATP